MTQETRLGTVPAKVFKEGRMTGMMNTLKLQDKLLRCVDCGTDFIFTAGEQRYFLSKGLSIPKRCPECRQKRKATLVPEGVRND